MRSRLILSVVALVLSAVPLARAQSAEAARVNDAATVFSEIMQAPDSGIPGAVIERAEAIAIFPGVVRAGFAVGGQWGRGIISVRDAKTGAWSAPAFLTIAGGSFGAQIGAQSLDLVLVVLDQTGVQRLLGNQFKIGGEASVAAGPIGRAAEASTDIQLRAKILSYSRTRGFFAGVALNGSTLASDRSANARFYGQRLGSRELIAATAARTDLPEAVEQLRKVLKLYAR